MVKFVHICSVNYCSFCILSYTCYVSSVLKGLVSGLRMICDANARTERIKEYT